MASIQRLPQPGDVIAGKYRVDHELGTGGMGAVYHVTHRVTGKRFALKWLLPQASGQGDAAQRFIREAQVAGRLEHPHVVEVYDVGAEAHSFYMVMELLEGESLAARVERLGPLSVQDACRLLIPCMHGVAEAHAVGIIHRDLKPANIFICGATRTTPEYAKVLDFGISKVAGAVDDVTSMTKSGTLIGTPHYMPLEQMRGRTVDHRADIYAFGVVLYQVLSGRLPFPADSFSDLVLMLAHETPRPLEELIPRLPRGLAPIISRAMARDPEDRHPHLGALIEDLQHFVELGGPAHRASLRPPTASLSIPTPLSTESQERRRQRTTASSAAWIVGGAAALVLALGAGTLWMNRGSIQGLEYLRATDPEPAAAVTETAAEPQPTRAATATAPSQSGSAAIPPRAAAPNGAAGTARAAEPNVAAAEAQEAPDRDIRTLDPARIDAPPEAAATAEPVPPKPPPHADQVPRIPETLPPVPRATTRPKATPIAPVVRVQPPPPPAPPEPEPIDRPKPRTGGRVPAITEDDFY